MGSDIGIVLLAGTPDGSDIGIVLLAGTPDFYSPDSVHGLLIFSLQVLKVELKGGGRK